MDEADRQTRRPPLAARARLRRVATRAASGASVRGRMPCRGWRGGLRARRPPAARTRLPPAARRARFAAGDAGSAGGRSQAASRFGGRCGRRCRGEACGFGRRARVGGVVAAADGEAGSGDRRGADAVAAAGGGGVGRRRVRRGAGGLRGSRFGRGRGVSVAPAASSPGSGRSRTRSGETSRRGVAMPSRLPRQAKAAVQVSSVSAAQGLWSSTAIRRLRRPSTRRCSVGRMKRRPRTPNQRPVTSSRSSEGHVKLSTSKARSASGSAGVSIRAIGVSPYPSKQERPASLSRDEAADRGGSGRPARVPQPAAARDRRAFQRPGSQAALVAIPFQVYTLTHSAALVGPARHRRTAANRGWQPARRRDRGPGRATQADARRAIGDRDQRRGAGRDHVRRGTAGRADLRLRRAAGGRRDGRQRHALGDRPRPRRRPPQSRAQHHLRPLPGRRGRRAGARRPDDRRARHRQRLHRAGRRLPDHDRRHRGAPEAPARTDHDRAPPDLRARSGGLHVRARQQRADGLVRDGPDGDDVRDAAGALRRARADRLRRGRKRHGPAVRQRVGGRGRRGAHDRLGRARALARTGS